MKPDHSVSMTIQGATHHKYVPHPSDASPLTGIPRSLKAVVWCRDLLKHLAVVLSWLSQRFPSLVWVSGEGVTVSGCTIMWLTCRPTVLFVLKYPSFNYHSPVSLFLPVSLSVFVCLPVCVCVFMCVSVCLGSFQQ